MAALADIKHRYFFPDSLKAKLEQVSYYPLTVIEAPAGFGKTTAVREHLNFCIDGEYKQHWFTCLGESRLISWKNICTLFSYADAETADSLRKFKIPMLDNLMYLAQLTRSLYCNTKTYIVIDNFHLTNFDIPHELISVCSMHECPNLHIIFITQNIGARPHIFFHNSNIHRIEAADFFFEKESTDAFFRMHNIRLTEKDLTNVQQNTEGWISAIQLQMLSYKQTGIFENTADIVQLVETAIWSRLTAEEKEFLISVSIMNSFTIRQAALLTGTETLSEGIYNFLRSNNFIKYFPRENIYNIHSILRDYIINQLYYHKPIEFQKRIVAIAGRCYAENMQLIEAAQLFLRIDEFDDILSLPFDAAYLANQEKQNVQKFLDAFFNKCPMETLCKYPFRVLNFVSYIALTNTKGQMLEKGINVLQRAINDNNANLGEQNLNRLKGEFELLTSVISHENTNEMKSGAEKAYKLIGGQSSIITKDVPWTLGSTSIVCLFWRELGKLDETLSALAKLLPKQIKVANGYGAGAYSAAQAETLLLKGEYNKAEVLCYKALYEANSMHQVSISICAQLLLAQIAIVRGDSALFTTAVENINSYAKENSYQYVTKMVEMCFLILNILLGPFGAACQASFDVAIMKNTYVTNTPCDKILYTYSLLNEKQYSKFFAETELILEKAKKANYILPQIFHLIFLSTAYYEKNKNEKAIAAFSAALKLALPEKIIMPFAIPIEAVSSLLDLVAASYVNDADFDGLLKLRNVCKKGTETINKALFQIKSDLTPREREVALLAKERLTRKEIAQKLFISEMTVKTILQNVYSKLDIHSKTELSSLKF